MSLIRCPDCGRDVSDQAPACPNCGRPVASAAGFARAAPYIYEYKSPRTVFGLPLVHVIFTPEGVRGPGPAIGVVALGNVACGVFAFGGIAFGAVALGGLGFGLISLGGVAIGLALGIGGLATGYAAVGGAAVGVYALGGLGIGAHTLQNDPEMLRSIKDLFGFFRSSRPEAGFAGDSGSSSVRAALGWLSSRL